MCKTQVKKKTQQIAETGRRILTLILADYKGPVAIRLWDGELATGHGTCTLYDDIPSAVDAS